MVGRRVIRLLDQQGADICPGQDNKQGYYANTQNTQPNIFSFLCHIYLY